ncbi:hypothetical protein C8R46DRAFT_1233752 [Mycena filopes]|nr:hypothetical protein C8R46DRAFT_1233752 [Mycena filopes]
MLQLLVIQHELGEESNLNGDTFLELLNGSIRPCRPDGSKALQAMFLATEPLELEHRRGWNIAEFATHQLKFNTAHTFYDPSLRPPTFTRTEHSSNPPSHPILFTVASAVAPLPEIDPAPVIKKRKGKEGSPDEPAAKRAKKGPETAMEDAGSDGKGVRTVRSKARGVTPATRKSQRLAKPT